MMFRKKAKKAPETFHFEEGEGVMGLAQEMRNLAQEIIKSFDARAARVAALRQETAAKLKDFRQEMKNVRHQLRRKAVDLRRFLGTSEASRRRDFQTMHQSIRAGQEARSRQLGGMLSGFRRTSEAAASHWRNMAATMAKRRASATR